MDCQLILNNDGYFRTAWARALELGGSSALIASMQQACLLRAEAPRPHEPHKPWITYEGMSPLWDKSITTSTGIVLGKRSGEPWIIVVHDFPLTPDYGDEDETDFLLDEALWQTLLASTPDDQQMPLDEAQRLATPPRLRDGLFTGPEMLQNPLFCALFGRGQEPYIEAHNAIAREYLLARLTHNRDLERVASEHRHFLDHPPLVSLDISKMFRDVPVHGARARYLTANRIIRFGLNAVSAFAETRYTTIDLSEASDDGLHFVTITS